MSFTSEVKEEICTLKLDKADKISELSGIIGSSFDGHNIRVVTESNMVARRIYSLIKDLFGIYPKVTVRKGYNYNKKFLYIVEVLENKKKVLDELGIGDFVPSLFIWADEALARAYLRGVFFTSGSINDPKTARYHLEFNLSNLNYAEFIKKLLNSFNLNSKILHRENHYMVYVKGASEIGDFLRMISAMKAVLYYEDIRIYRDHKNMTNRLNNCEQANVDRAIETALNQVKDIKFIENNGNLDMLNEKEKIAANYRLKYPEASLLELAEIISMETETKTSKSSLYYRFKKISEIALKIKENYK